MSDTPPNINSPSSMSRAQTSVGNFLRADVLLAAGIICILLFMLIPVPAWILDGGISVSIMLSVLVLMTVLFIASPLEFTTFPTVLLLTTSLRLGLNVASTRLILSEGHSGQDAAGQIIKAFGSFIIQDSYVVGGIVFAILVIVNFVVITKGSGRIAEVAARFTLDAMPGKQMAIDADLSSGIITEDEAKGRRKKLESESSFYGAMDGAAKFVRGDAIAGLLIVFINIIGGIIIGTAFQGMSVGEAAQNYTILTIGDGLVSQIPALIISVSAGLLVSKAGVEGTAEKVMFEQFAGHPKAMGISGALMITLGLVPQVPFLPFFCLGAAAGAIAFFSMRNNQEIAQVKLDAIEAKGKSQATPAEEPISKALAIDTIRVELGYGLLPLVQGEGNNKLTDQIKGLRRQLAEDMGYILPAVRIQDNLQLPSQTYTVRIKEIEVGRGEIRPAMLMAMDPSGEQISLPGENTIEPTFGLPAMWIDEQYREEAHFKGYTVVDAPTVVTTHITEIIKDNMSDLLSYAETQKLLNEMPEAYQKLVADVIPNQVTVSGLQRILQNLVSERVSVRDLPTILEGVSETAGYTKNPMRITEHVRSRLARQLCHDNANVNNVLTMVTLAPEWEQAFAEALIGDGEEKQLAMQPSRLQDFINRVRTAFDEQLKNGETPVLLTSPGIRPYVRSVIERFRPQTVVMSQNEIHPKAQIKTLGQV